MNATHIRLHSSKSVTVSFWAVPICGHRSLRVWRCWHMTVHKLLKGFYSPNWSLWVISNTTVTAIVRSQRIAQISQLIVKQDSSIHIKLVLATGRNRRQFRVKSFLNKTLASSSCSACWRLFVASFVYWNRRKSTDTYLMTTLIFRRFT